MPNPRTALIAGTHSGVGKTTWTLLLSLLARQRGLVVQPFKCGPDYIDTAFHSRICAPRKSRNLDLFLLSESYVRRSFLEHSQGADMVLVEGVMGLFDGRKTQGLEGSSAQIAKVLNLPVFLVLDGSGLASTAAAIVLGFQKFDPDLQLSGIFFNGVNSESHFKWLKEAVEAKTEIPCLGYLPKDAEIRIPERHLGLTTAVEAGPEMMDKIQKGAELLEGRFDWEGFLKAAENTASYPPEDGRSSDEEANSQILPFPASCRIAIAYDEAFSFYYQDNFDILRNAGAELFFFSPLQDWKLPPDMDLLYLGGGFPELYASRLLMNQSMTDSIRRFRAEGGFIYAECGGLIYLCQAGLLPGKIQMTKRLQHFGYHEIEALEDTFLFPKGTRLRSHEFHYSEWLHEETCPSLYRIGDRSEGFSSERILASYQHLHFGTDPEMVPRLLKNLKEKRKTYDSSLV